MLRGHVQLLTQCTSLHGVLCKFPRMVVRLDLSTELRQLVFGFRILHTPVARYYGIGFRCARNAQTG